MKAVGHLLGRFLRVAFLVIAANAGNAPFALGQTASDNSGDQKSTQLPPQEFAFEVTIARAVVSEPIAGRVYVLLGPESSPLPPRYGPDCFRPQPFFAVNVRNWQPGEPLRIDFRSDGFPGSLKELEPGPYAIQAVARLNRDTHKIGDGEGNAYGPVVRARLNPKQGGLVSLEVDSLIAPRAFRSTEQVKLVELASPKLAAFHHRPIKHRATVILPKAMREGNRGAKRPTVYIIPGFGDDHSMARRLAYDIRLYLERNWPVLGPKLKGKLHVITGDMDTFYLDGAVKLLKQSLTTLGSDAVVEIVTHRDHSSLLGQQLSDRLDREMNAAVSDLLAGQFSTRD